MKSIWVATFIIFAIGCKAQTPIIDIEDYSYKNSIANAYYKDVNNYLNPFEGTWIYTDGNISFKIIIEKEVQGYTGKFYVDALKGEYLYVKNGFEKINTLSNLNNQYHHAISGNSILNNGNRPECNNCPPGEKRVSLSFSDPEHQLGGEMVLQRISVNGQPALKAFKKTTSYYISMTERSTYKFMLVPNGEYILIKVP